MSFKKLWLATIAALWCSITVSAHDFEVSGIFYNIISEENSTVEVSFRGSTYDEYSQEYSGRVTIPSSVTYNGKIYSVVRIGETAFWKCSSLTSVTIPNSVTNIGTSAFGRTGLKSITIPNSVTTLEYGAFQYCSNLTSVTLSNQLDTIGDYAFYYCTSLTSIDIPSSVACIGDGAFAVCSALANITMCDKDISVGNAFYSTAWYNSQPDGVLYLAKCLYGYKGTMPSNTSIIVNDGTLCIADCAFVNCTGLTSITIPNSVASIGGRAFDNTGLTNVTIPNSVTCIGEMAFGNCTSLTSITIHNSITSIGKSAFYGCTSLRNIHGGDLTWWCNIDFGDGYSNPLYYAKNLYLDGELLGGNLVIPDNVTEIKDYAFYKYASLQSVTIPSNVTSIGEEAFYGCSNLKTVYNFSELNIAKSSQENGYVAYNAYVVIDKTLELVDDFYFKTIDGIHTLLYYKGSAATLTLPEDYKGESYKIGSYAFADNVSVQNIVISAGVTSIEESAFKGCCNLERITIGENVKKIGNAAFYDCSELRTVINLTEMSFKKFSTTFGYVAYNAYVLVDKNDVKVDDFYFRTGNGVHTLLCYVGDAKELTLPDSYNGENYNIGSYAFFRCSNLVSVDMGDGVVEIGSNAFDNCSNLASVSMGDGVVEIGSYAFVLCRNLVSVDMGDGVIEIGNSAFYYCSNLKNIEVSKSLTSIGTYAFYNCQSLTIIEIPEGVVSIGSNAFYDCSNLKVVINLSDLLITKGATTFGYVANYASLLVNKNDEFIDGFYFRTLNGEHTLVYYASNEIELSLPDDYNGENYSVGTYAFHNCIGLKSIKIPSSVTSIASYAFNGCTSLTELYIEDGCEVLSMGHNGIYRGLLSDCPLETLYLGRDFSYNLYTYQYNYSPFYNKSELTTLTIGENVTNIVDKAFLGCNGLTTITIPEGVTSIGNDAFFGCSKLKDMVVQNIVPPTVKYSSLGTDPLTVIVPYQSVEAYCNADYWKNQNIVGYNTVIYVVDGEVFKTELFAYGSTITPIAEPTKEGHTFGGWSEIPEIMPSEDVIVNGSFTTNRYNLIYMIDGEVYETIEVEYGSPITPFAKEGYTFSWSEIPATMPAEDITVTGTFTINQYRVTFALNGVEQKTEVLEYGTTIEAPTFPDKEGYTLTWSEEIPATVPAKDVYYNATYVAKVYQVYYFVGSNLVHIADVPYGEKIPEYIYEPEEGEGEFLYWTGNDCEFMPAGDVCFTAVLSGMDTNVERWEIGNENSAIIYDLQGRRVLKTENLKGGIYIVDGKKVIIK